MAITRSVAKWAAEVSADWPATAMERAIHVMEDALVSAVAGAGDAGSAILRETARAQGQGRATLIGATVGVPAMAAALANGYATHAVEMDDNFYPGLGHAGCVIFPAIWALAEETDAAGHAVLDAFIVGTEVMARIGQGIGRAHTDRGWHGTSTIGALAAAAASARLLKLNVSKMTAAISLAASMAAGAKGQFGTSAKPLQAGLAAQAGVLAARLAENGLTGSETILEGRSGFGELYAGTVAPDWSAAEKPASEPLAIEKWGFAFKRHPCCGSAHRVVDGVIELRNEHGFTAEQVASVVAYVGFGNALNLRYPAPRNDLEARFSMPYCIAVALRHGRLRLADFTPQAVRDERTRALMPLVDMRVHPGSGEGADNTDPANREPHRAIVTLKDGRCFERKVKWPRGTPENPFSAEDRRGKFDDCCIGVLNDRGIEAIRAALVDPAALRSIRDLTRHLAFEASTDTGERFSRQRVSAAEFLD